MSVVTNVILVTGLLDHEHVDKVNEWLRTQRFGFDGHGWGELVRVDERAGGTKAMEVNVYVGAFNHLAVDHFVEYVFGLPWRWPTDWALLTQTDAESFRVHTLAKRDLSER